MKDSILRRLGALKRSFEVCLTGCIRVDRSV